MKKLISVFLLFLLLISISSKAQIRNVIVEKYYVSDTLDATDSSNYQSDPNYLTPILPVGSKTYRIYVQLDSGYKIHKIYGTLSHPLKFISTANYFNFIDRPDEYFGYLFKKSLFNGNPTLALDSWLTLGLCATVSSSLKYTALLKSEDPDGSIIGGTHNGGGTQSIPGGILRNNDTAAGIPVDTADGMVPNTAIYTSWLNDGFLDGNSVDTTAFGSVNVSSQFISTTAFLQQGNGVEGDSATGGNKVLVAQLTTTGDITFEINFELMSGSGTNIHYTNVVPANSTGDTLVSRYLKYPPDAPVCGCKDPNYLEYNPTYTCSNTDSCKNLIVFGCMDTLACNYDPHANYHIQSLCCYPGKCNDRDISLVCPRISSESGFSIYPNPVSTLLTMQFYAGTNEQIKYVIYDSYGTIINEKELGTLTGVYTQQLDVSDFHTGLYLIRLFIGNSSQSKSFMKN